MSSEKDEKEVLDEDQADTEDTSDVDEVQVLKDEIAELEDAKLRMAAEMQNTRKRLAKQQQEDYKYRHQDILRDLAEVIDNFERAIVSSMESRDFDTFHEGIEMIGKQFTGMLTEKYSLARIGEVGEAFDPVLHEAMMMEESPEVDGARVKQIFQAGYRLHDRVLRHAKVVVVKPVQGDGDSDNEIDKKDNEEGAE